LAYGKVPDRGQGPCGPKPREPHRCVSRIALPDCSKNLSALQNGENPAKARLAMADNMQSAQWSAARTWFAMDALGRHTPPGHP